MPVRVLVLRAAGVNCDIETARAFEIAGAAVQRIHFNQIIESPGLLEQFQILALPGGFSYGDDLSAGKILALQLSHRLGDSLWKFVSQRKLILGICNGFQTLVKMHLLFAPNSGGAQQATLARNLDGRFNDRWITLQVRSKKCVWTTGLDQLELPIAHSEGRFLTRDDSVRQSLWDNDQVAMIYAGENRSGSVDAIAGICDPSGLVLGVMPHPERAVFRQQHYAWTSQSAQSEFADGLAIFQNGVSWFE